MKCDFHDGSRTGCYNACSPATVKAPGSMTGSSLSCKELLKLKLEAAFSGFMNATSLQERARQKIAGLGY